MTEVHIAIVEGHAGVKKVQSVVNGKVMVEADEWSALMTDPSIARSFVETHEKKAAAYRKIAEYAVAQEDVALSARRDVILSGFSNLPYSQATGALQRLVNKYIELEDELTNLKGKLR